MPTFEDEAPEGFAKPTVLPKTPEQARQWQEANRSWWEAHPMRYDWKTKVAPEEFTEEFFRAVDERFFSDAKVYLPWKKVPFDSLINFDSLQDKDVLEIGVGTGSHAQLLAQHARSFTGIDITDYAVKSTSRRLECFGLNGTALRMDAEDMQFDNSTFDFIWTWGVIHHSSHTQKVLREMHRVLRPGGQAITMVYHRGFWNYYIVGGLLLGVLRGNLLRTRSLHKIVQRHTDGAIARFYSTSEWKGLVSELFRVEKIMILGSKSEIVPLPGGRIKGIVMALVPNRFSRFLTNRCRMGGFLVSVLKKTP